LPVFAPFFVNDLVTCSTEIRDCFNAFK